MTVLTEALQGCALVLTLNRPESRNALSTELVQALLEAVAQSRQRKDVRALVIIGAGDKAFSAGTDLKERRTLSQAQKAAQSRSLLTLSEAIWDHPKPVIAAVGGYCLGGGAELAMACDLRIAADDVEFGFPEMTLGVYPGSGGPVTLSRLVGATRAKDLLFTARRFGALEAQAMGLVERVVPRAGLLDAAVAWATEMEATSPLALAALKKSINEGMSLSLQDAAALDQRIRRPLDASKDNEEGMRAQLEKRRPRFTGE